MSFNAARPFWRMLIATALAVPANAAAVDSDVYQVGVSAVDTTPDYPIRLNGFGSRRDESEGVSQPIFARALAIRHAEDNAPLVLVTLDSLGIRTPMVDEVARRLADSHKLPPENLAVTFSHSHCTPKVNGACDNIFSSAIPDAHQAHIDRYTNELTDHIASAARQALDAMQPARLEWTVGKVKFAKNRRTAGGPIDHDLPMLVVRSTATHRPKAIYVSYACHCTTLSFNQISGDWVGYAAAMIERQIPGVTAMVSIGAGSDQKPGPGVQRDRVDIARGQGIEIADEVTRLLDGPLRPIDGATRAMKRQIPLPLDTLPTREELEARTRKGRPTDKYNATTQLARLDRSEPLLDHIDYTIQTWTFGDSLCMNFLAGEVCVDYSLRLKSAVDRDRFWLNAYSNDFCSYIPSERLVEEGGYGGGSEVPYFALPTTLKAGLEQLIVDEVLRQVPDEFEATSGTRGIRPESPEVSLECMQTADAFEVQLVAAEPDVQDPVAIDFGADGRLWVAEMNEYGHGVYEKFESNSRVRWLRDDDGDGRFETAKTFVDGLRFPTDVKVWRDGVLICDAPEIKFARDIDDDGVADDITTLYSGFEVRNAQARVNSLRWGLDGWLHGSGGLFGGKIKSHRTGAVVDCRNRDFRIRPDSGAIEAVSSRTQQGRDRNDQGDWFGCSNGTLLRAIPPTISSGRSESGVVPSTPKLLALTTAAQTLVPPNRLVRFELSGLPGQATSACGLCVYRDATLGSDFRGDAFTCEPIHQSVHRIDLSRDGHGYVGQRGRGEEAREFLMSTDRWFRPVQVRTGPDGALWVVDMYRFVIEHPRWIPQSSLAELDVFAGQKRGRIYRVAAKRLANAASPVIPDLRSESNSQLAERLRSPNGTVRDTAHQLLIWRAATDAVDTIRQVARDSANRPAAIQALAALADLDQLSVGDLEHALRSADSGIVSAALRLSRRLDSAPELQDIITALSQHDDVSVRRVVALVLRELNSGEATTALTLLIGDADVHVRSAALSGIGKHNIDEILQSRRGGDSEVAEIALRIGAPATMRRAFRMALPKDYAVPDPARATRLARALNILDERFADQPIAIELVEAEQFCQVLVATATSYDTAHPESSIALMGRRFGNFTRGLMGTLAKSFNAEVRVGMLARFASASQPVDVQRSAIRGIAQIGGRHASASLLEILPRVGFDVRDDVLEQLVSTNDGAQALLEAVRNERIRSNQLGAVLRQKLLSGGDAETRSLAKEIFSADGDSSRAKVLETFATALKMDGDATAGKRVFTKRCANCHRLGNEGHEVGPNLKALTNRNPRWLLTAIIDPNRNVDARYMAWTAVTNAGRSLSGMIVDETADTIRLREAGGREHVIPRDGIDEFRSTQLSMMPEGLEKDLTPNDAANVIAFLIASSSTTTANEFVLPRRPPQIAPFLLDDSNSIEIRQKAIDARPGMGPPILSLLTRELTANDIEEQYRRMPWIFRVALAVGKRNDGGEIRDVLEKALPQTGEPMLDWQAVVLGGGLINGLSQLGVSPQDRLEEVFSGLPESRAHWPEVLKQAASIADAEDVKLGTRYDALRMVALNDPQTAVDHLSRYLKPDAKRQLQMGAVSGLIDVETPDADSRLVSALSWLKERNRFLALEGMLRSDDRSRQLSGLVQSGTVKFTAAEVRQLTNHTVPEIRTRMQSLVRLRVRAR